MLGRECPFRGCGRMTAVMLMVLAVFVLILALLVNAQTRKFLYQLDAYAQCWPGKGYWLNDNNNDQVHPDGREGTD